jgi:hypothetical protein
MWSPEILRGQPFDAGRANFGTDSINANFSASFVSADVRETGSVAPGGCGAHLSVPQFSDAGDERAAAFPLLTGWAKLNGLDSEPYHRTFWPVSSIIQTVATPSFCHETSPSSMPTPKLPDRHFPKCPFWKTCTLPGISHHPKCRIGYDDRGRMDVSSILD